MADPEQGIDQEEDANLVQDDSVEQDDHEGQALLIDKNPSNTPKCCFNNNCGAMMHILTVISTIALAASLIRCVLLATLAGQDYKDPLNNSYFAFDLIHAFIQGVHVAEYFALLYGIGGFYLYVLIQRENYEKLNVIFKKSCRCVCGWNCVGAVALYGLGLVIFIIPTFTPIAILTCWPEIVGEIRMENITVTTAKCSNLSRFPTTTFTYIGISYISHICHSLTRVYMIYATVVARSAWRYHTRPKLKIGTISGLLDCAKVILRPKWLEDETDDGDSEAPKNLKDMLALIDNYNITGHFVAPLHGIFQQWFVMQWVVYFIKIIEDFKIIINSVIEDHHVDPELLFVVTHLVYDLTLFLIPFYCASLLNSYHDEYHKRLQMVQKSILCEEAEGWRLQCAFLIPQKSEYIFIPSFCGLSIPLSNPGYNLSILFALLAFIIAVN